MVATMDGTSNTCQCYNYMKKNGMHAEHAAQSVRSVISKCWRSYNVPADQCGVGGFHNWSAILAPYCCRLFV